MKKKLRTFILLGLIGVILVSAFIVLDLGPNIAGRIFELSGQIGITKSQALFNDAQSLFEEKKYEKAIKEYQKIIDKYPTSNLVEEAFLMLGICQILLGNDKDALVVFQEIIDDYSDSPVTSLALYYSAKIYVKMREYQKAKEYYGRILKNSPDTPEWVIYRTQKLLEKLTQK